MELLADKRAKLWAKGMRGELVAMRREGLPNAEIAARLWVSLTVLEGQVSKLIREGALGSRRGLLCSHPDSWVEGRERTRHEVAPAVERLYREDKSREEIGAELNLTGAQVHNILASLFAAGLPKRHRRALSDEQARAIHAAHLARASIHQLAAEIGFSGTAACNRLHRLGLPVNGVPRR